MTFLCKIKIFVLSTLAFYSVYLYSYKCHEKTLLETLIQPGTASQLVHPFSEQQNQLCHALHSGTDLVAPYVNVISDFIDQRVQSLAIVKQYKVKSKVEKVKANYHKLAHPYVHKLMQYFEITEYHIATNLHNLIGQGKKHYQNTIAPKVYNAKDAAATKVHEAKDAAATKYEEVMDAAATQLSVAKDAAATKISVAKDSAATQLSVAKDAAGEHYKEGKKVAGEYYENGKNAAGEHYKEGKKVAGEYYENGKKAAGKQYQQVMDAAGNKIGEAEAAAESLKDQFTSQLKVAKDEIKSKF